MVSSFTSAPRSGFTILRKAGSSSRNLDSAFCYFTAVGQYFVDGGAFWWLFTQLDVWIPTLMSYVPDWLQWLSYLLWPPAVISVLLVFGYFFSTIANWIAAPVQRLIG